MKSEKRRIRTNKGLKEYSYLGCPLTRNKTAWCYRICQLDEHGHGFCGRIAPHSLKSTIQVGIENYNKKKLGIHHKKLENLYLKNQSDALYETGISIREGEVEIISSIGRQHCNLDGTILSTVCSLFLQQAAEFAVNSKVSTFFVMAEHFNYYLSNVLAQDKLITRARFLHKSGNQFFAESIIIDSNRTEIARGNGVFIISKTPLESDLNYK